MTGRRKNFHNFSMFLYSIFMLIPIISILLIMIDIVPQPNTWHPLWTALLSLISLIAMLIIINTLRNLRAVYLSLEKTYNNHLCKIDKTLSTEKPLSILQMVDKLYRYIGIITLENQILYDTALTIHTSSSLQELVDTVVARLNTHLKGDFALVFLLEDNYLNLAASANVEEQSIYRTSFRMGEGLAGYSVQEDEAILTHNVRKDGRYIKCVVGCKSQITVPLKIYNKRIGVLVLGSYQSHHFKEKDLHILKTMSSEIALAINNSQLTEELKEEKEKVTTLYEITQEIAASIQIDEVMETGLNNLVDITDATSCSLMLFDETEKVLKITASKGLSKETGENLVFKVGEGIAGKVFQEETPLLIEDVNEEPQFKLMPNQKEGFKSLYTIPLNTEEKCIGVINVTTHQPLSEEECNLVEAITNQLAMAVKNALHYQTIEDLAIKDELTGLHNYRYFQGMFEKEVRRAKRYHRHLSLAILDIDNFKRYNDTYGHMIGDYMIQTVSSILEDGIRGSDILARYGGDELVIILPETDTEEAAALMERLKDRIAGETFHDHEKQDSEIDEDKEIQSSSLKNRVMDWLNEKHMILKNRFDQMPNQLTISVGICSLKDLEEQDDEEMLLKRADEALLHAKQKGKNQICSWKDL